MRHCKRCLRRDYFPQKDYGFWGSQFWETPPTGAQMDQGDGYWVVVTVDW